MHSIRAIQQKGADMSKTKSPSAGRRDFLKTTGAIGIGFMTSTAAAQDNTAANNLVNIALVGCGGRGTGAVDDNMSINKNTRIVALADVDTGKFERTKRFADKFAERNGLADSKMHGGLDGYKRVLEDKDVDLVLFATPPGFRPYHIADAVKAGKHVFAEKPSCVDPAGYRVCLAAHDEAVKNKTAIVTGTQYRRQTNYIGAVEQIRAGAIGEIISATTRYCASGIWYRGRGAGMSDVQYQIHNWMHFIWLSGDQIAEQAVHNIDAMNWVMGGPPIAAYGSGGRFTRPSDSEMWDNVSLDYEYPGGRLLSFMCRQIPGTQGDNGNVIYGTKATMHIAAMSGGSKIVDHDGKVVWSMQGSIDAAYRQEHKDLVDSIVAGKPIVELKETADSSLTAVMGRMAAYTGQRVTWDFVTTQSKLDLFPKGLTIDGTLPVPAFAVPGQTKLV
jgi:predicted dehydrogenase